MELFLRDKVAIITGGASGIGEKTADFFIQEKVKVLIADIQKERVEKTIAALRAKGGPPRGAFAM